MNLNAPVFTNFVIPALSIIFPCLIFLASQRWEKLKMSSNPLGDTGVATIGAGLRDRENTVQQLDAQERLIVQGAAVAMALGKVVEAVNNAAQASIASARADQESRREVLEEMRRFRNAVEDSVAALRRNQPH